MSDAITVLSDTTFVSLVNTTWQITLLIPLVALLIRVFRIKSAATRYSLWLFVLFAIIALPLITPFIPQIDVAQFRSQRAAGDRPGDLVRLGMGDGEAGELPEDGDSVPSVGTAKVHANRGSDVSLINPVSIAYLIWCAGALFTFCIILGAHINLRRLRVSSPDVKDPAALEMLSRLKQRVRVRRPVALKVSSKIYTPMSLGIFSPTIILPDGGFRGISELEMILTHELAHIRRCDYLVNILQNILKAIFFFHPLYHLMNRNLAKEREHICDDWVIHVTEQRSGYAECIIGLLERAVHKPVNVPVTLAMAERKRDIPGRIDMIVDKKREIITRVPRKFLIMMIFIGCLVIPVIGGIEVVRFAIANPASEEGWIVYYNRDEQGLWIMDANGKNERQLTHFRDEYPKWSPDGQQIAFARWSKDDPDSAGIHIMNGDGSNIRRLTDWQDDGYDGGPTWSPDGRQIAFSRPVWQDEDTDGDGIIGIETQSIYVINSDGTGLRRLTAENPAHHDSFPDWSPDGTMIAFTRSNSDDPKILVPGGRAIQIWTMDQDGNNQEILNDTLGAFEPTWSPSGAMIAFWRLPGIGQLGIDIYVMDSDGANIKALTNNQADTLGPDWSEDSTKIIFCSNRSGLFKIYIMNADGSDPRKITADATANEFSPDWTAFSYAVEPAGKLKTTWGNIKALLLPH